MAQQVQLPARFANRQQKRSLVEGIVQVGNVSPPHVSIMGSAFTLVDANGEKEPVETKWLDCVIFDTNLEVSVQRVFWGLDERNEPKGFDQNSGLPPECFSDNGIGASAQASNPQSASCQMCPMNRFDWVSKRDAGKRTKACNVIKKVAVLPVEGKVEADGTYTPATTQDFPFVLRVPVMSHDNLRAYGDKFRGQDFDVSDVVTRITFVHGQVGQLDFNAAGFTDQATEDLVNKFLASKITDGLVGRGDRPWTGALPAPAQDAQPRQADARPLPAPSAPSVPISTAAPSPTAAAEAPAKRGRKPKEAPAPESDLGGIPPFLQRQQPTPAANGPAHGIQHNAPAPNAELESALADVFGLKT